MPKPPLFSIVTVCYQSEATLEKTIDSVISQSFSDFEYIIIDGGSNDSTVDIIKKHQDQLSYWVSEPDRGISDAFNKGIEKCLGQYILLLNSDDVFIDDNSLQLVADFIHEQQFPEAILHGKVRQVFADGSHSDSPPPGESVIRWRIPYFHPGAFVHREVYASTGVFNPDIKVCMDYDLYIRHHQKRGAFLHYPFPTVIHLPGGLSYHGFLQGFWEAKKIHDQYFGQPWLNLLNYLRHVIPMYLARKSCLAPWIQKYRGQQGQHQT